MDATAEYLILGYIRTIIAFRVPGPIEAVPPALRAEDEPTVDPPGAVPTENVTAPALPGPSVASGSAPGDAQGSAECVSATRNVCVLIRNESLTFLSLCIMCIQIHNKIKWIRNTDSFHSFFRAIVYNKFKSLDMYV